MNLTQLANLGEFIGGVAVLVTLIYLALQLRQGLQWNKRVAFGETLTILLGFTDQVAESKELAQLYNQGRAHLESLDEDDALRFHCLQLRRYAAFERVIDFHRVGAIKAELLEAVRRIVREDLAHPGCRRWWEIEGRTIFADDFSEWIDGIAPPG